MDTLASLVFGIIVINAIKAKGVTDKKKIAGSQLKSSLIAAACLGLIYLGLGYLGSTTNFAAGEANNGPVILTESAASAFRYLWKYYSWFCDSFCLFNNCDWINFILCKLLFKVCFHALLINN